MKITDALIEEFNTRLQIPSENTYKTKIGVVPELLISDVDHKSVLVGTGEDTLQIDYFLECIFITLCEFTYIPVWFMKILIKEKYGVFIEEEKVIEMIRKLIELNLVINESLPQGDIIRPTQYLYEIVKMPVKKNSAIPFNMLAHDISKMDYYVHCLMGKQPVVKKALEDMNVTDEQLLEPKDPINVRNNIENKEMKENVSNLFLEQTEQKKLHISIGNVKETEGDNNGFLAVDEKEIRVARDNIELISNIDNEIKDGIRKGLKKTRELEDFTGFFSSVETKSGYELQYPDLIIPVLRGERQVPCSIAVEIELTAKGYSHYPINLNKYKNSIKYGSVIWACGESRVKEHLYNALKEIGGLGWTKCYIIDYTPPRKREI